MEIFEDHFTEESFKYDARKYYERRIKPLYGADEFKELMSEIIDVEPRIKKDKTLDLFAHRNYLFSIDDGASIDEYLAILHDIVMLRGLMKLSTKAPYEYFRIPLPKEKEKLYPETCKVLGDIFEKGPNIICLDISELLSDLRSYDFRRILLLLERHYKMGIIVFRTPYLSKEISEEVYSALNDVMTVRRVQFPPLTLDQMTEYGKSKLTEYGFTADEKVWELFRRRIIEEKNEGKFYENMTVDKLVRELIYTKECSDVRGGKNDMLITPEDIRGFACDAELREETAEEMLGKLVGLDDIIAQIRELTQTVAYVRQDKSLKPPCLHMRFTGNPGTGKTTLARIIGKLFKEQGILSKGDFFEVFGRDLCGSYVGHTAPLTERICRDAYGSVLFIDEAYTLYRKDGSANDYGFEALSALIGEMENHRSDLVVIFAGYSDEMDELMSGNPGLASRIPYFIEFPNYSREQLANIFFSLIPPTVDCGEDFKACVREYFDSISDDVLQSKEFSNARFVRNIFESTLSKAVVRKNDEGLDRLSFRPEDFELACMGKSVTQLMETKKRYLGFSG